MGSPTKTVSAASETSETNSSDFSTYHNGVANVRTKHLASAEIERIVQEMYVTYYDRNYLKFTLVRKVYPRYFWTLVLKEVWLHIKRRALHYSSKVLRRPGIIDRKSLKQ